MQEKLHALEERLNHLEQEYLLAKERHEFLQQYDLYEEMKQIWKERRDLKKQAKLCS
ncbi:flavoprotein [Croceifilum oryzae]|uniref:Flavoprotein n=1 Tax=Croceifilum oryzae TaxID=1553429 RepID=A0AAJ1TJN2_9BACL|nr:hypothetical protein [Croceifilum oryzae]MDQ0417737.1 flavoprotein [Croceifilum oryzae]